MIVVRPGTVAGVLAGVLALAVPAASTADPYSPQRQSENIQLAGTRSQELTPEFLQMVASAAARRTAQRVAMLGSDPERQPDPNFCTTQLCVGDPRLDGWEDGRGIVKPVAFTARDGATLSGHVWATRRGPAKRPGIVIVNGSIVGFEQANWWAAQSLAKSGYVVFTFDPQGEGNSDQFGAAPDVGESLLAGTPPIGDGGPFYDGGTDAIDFFLSSAADPYRPRPSRTSGTSHAGKQARRVAAGLNAAANPLAAMLDHKRIGIAGHSYGAMAASYLGQADRRIGAVVAWDSLCLPHNSTQTELQALGVPDPGGSASLLGVVPLPNAATSFPRDCFGAPPGYRADIKPRVPALGLTNDYILAPYPFTERPDRDYKARVAEAYRAAGVDSGNLSVRGGTHFEWSFTAFPSGTLRGIDLGTWYTTAWFDKYLKRDPTADSRLLSGRWRDDARGAAADPARDPNLFSEFYRSPISIRVGGKWVACGDLRRGCSNLVPEADDCGSSGYGYLKVATRPDDGTNPHLATCSAATRISVRPARRWRTKRARRPAVLVGTAGRRVLRVRVALAQRRRGKWRTIARGRLRGSLAPGRGRVLRLRPQRRLRRGTYRITVTGRTVGAAPRPVRATRAVRLHR